MESKLKEKNQYQNIWRYVLDYYESKPYKKSSEKDVPDFCPEPFFRALRGAIDKPAKQKIKNFVKNNAVRKIAKLLPMGEWCQAHAPKTYKELFPILIKRLDETPNIITRAHTPAEELAYPSSRAAGGYSSCIYLDSAIKTKNKNEVSNMLNMLEPAINNQKIMQASYMTEAFNFLSLNGKTVAKILFDFRHHPSVCFYPDPVVFYARFGSNKQAITVKEEFDNFKTDTALRYAAKNKNDQFVAHLVKNDIAVPLKGRDTVVRSLKRAGWSQNNIMTTIL